MKIALVHDYLKEYGGAESVLEALSDLFPTAPIYTTLYHPASFGPHRSRLEAKWGSRIHQSFFHYFPFVHKLLSPLRFLSPLAFRSFDFSGYDLIISSATGAFFPNSLNKKNAKLICYCHTPPRYLYGLATARHLDNLFYRLVNIPLQFVLHFYRIFDFYFSQNVDQYLANSATTARRIQKFYRRKSLVIHPPVALPKVAPLSRGAPASAGEGFYLAGGRLARAKRYDIAIQACKQLNLPLKVFGRDFAGYEAELRQIAGLSAAASAKAEPNVEFLGEVTQAQKEELFQNASGYLFCSDNEDFGIVAVEAQGYGCPVVGYQSGGIKETVVNGKTGVLFDQLTPESCAQAILRLQKLKISSQACFKHAQQFSPEFFVQKIKKLVSSF